MPYYEKISTEFLNVFSRHFFILAEMKRFFKDCLQKVIETQMVTTSLSNSGALHYGVSVFEGMKALKVNTLPTCLA